MSMLVELAEDLLTRTRCERRSRRSWSAHDALQLRFEQVDGQWWQQVGPAVPSGMPRMATTCLGSTEPRQQAAMVAAATAARPTVISGSVGLTEGWCCSKHGDGQRARSFLSAHHLVVDSVSWRILLDDLDTAYRHALAGSEVALEPPCTAATAWAHRLAEHVRSGALDGALEYWTQVSREAQVNLPVDRAGVHTAGSTRQVTVRLSRARTDALLHRVPGVYRTQINDVLLSALGRVLSRWTGCERVLIALEGHGREEILDSVELCSAPWAGSPRSSRWRSPVPAGSDWRFVLPSVKEQRRRAVPHRGLSYGRCVIWAGADLPGRRAALLPWPRRSSTRTTANGLLRKATTRPLLRAGCTAAANARQHRRRSGAATSRPRIWLTSRARCRTGSWSDLALPEAGTRQRHSAAAGRGYDQGAR